MFVFVCSSEFWRFFKIADKFQYIAVQWVVINTCYHGNEVTNKCVWELQTDFQKGLTDDLQ
jgi:alkyl hydroperoxide reductase subunit AhpC